MGTLLQVHYHARRLRLASAFSLCGAALVLGGCVSAPTATAYGNYVTGSPAFNQKLASDAVNQLVVLYPPANTRFNLTQPTPDLFGAALLAGLREKGYAVVESNPAGAIDPPAASASAASGPATAVAGLDLRYVVDQPGAGDLYRLILAIGSQSLTRAYVAQNEGTYAAGSWVRKE